MDATVQALATEMRGEASHRGRRNAKFASTAPQMWDPRLSDHEPSFPGTPSEHFFCKGERGIEHDLLALVTSSALALTFALWAQACARLSVGEPNRDPLNCSVLARNNFIVQFVLYKTTLTETNESSDDSHDGCSGKGSGQAG